VLLSFAVTIYLAKGVLAQVYSNVLASFLSLNPFIQGLIVICLGMLLYLVLADPSAAGARAAALIGLVGMFAAGHTSDPPK